MAERDGVHAVGVGRTTGIEWTDATWNPVVGCTPVSPGCLNCYAATMARRLEGMGVKEYAPRTPDELPPMPNAERLVGVWCRCGGEVWFQNLHSVGKASREWAWEAFCRKCKACDVNGYSSRAKLLKESPMFWGDRRIRIAEVRGGRAVFTGDVRTVPDRLTVGGPLGWKKPRMVFVNSMSDLFHEAVPFEFIDKVFAVMALCPQHTFQVLTKRPERMAEYMNGLPGMERSARVIEQAIEIGDCGFVHQDGRRVFEVKRGVDRPVPKWPLPNVWVGTSVEDQARADERIPHLLRCPAVVRFLSCEPLLGAIDLTRVAACVLCPQRPLHRVDVLRGGTWEIRVPAPPPAFTQHSDMQKIDWVIVGGESGPHARPCDIAWVRSILKQCEAAGVPCFVKQLGAWPCAVGDAFYSWADDMGWHLAADDRLSIDSGMSMRPRLNDRKGGDMAEWPEDLRVREMPDRRSGGNSKSANGKSVNEEPSASVPSASSL